MDERGRYLVQVAAGLPFEVAEQQEMLEELAAHLDDSVAALQAEGLAADDAQRAALDRLGPPAALATALTQARLTPRRLLAAAGIGTWASVTGVFVGYLWGLLLVTLGGIALSLAMSTASFIVGVNWAGLDDADNAAITLVALAIAAYATGVRVPGAVAARAGYRQAVVRRILVPLGAAMWLAVGLVARSGPLDWPGVVVLLSLPIWYTVGGLRAAGTRFPPRGWSRPAAALMAVGAVVFAAGALVATGAVRGDGATVASGTPEPASDDGAHGFGQIGAPVPIALAQTQLGGTSILAGGWIWVSTVLPDRAMLAGWRDLRVEAWRGTGPLAVDPSASGPFVMGAATVGPAASTRPGAGRRRRRCRRPRWA
jgi:hypothetical protein